MFRMGKADHPFLLKLRTKKRSEIRTVFHSTLKFSFFFYYWYHIPFNLKFCLADWSIPSSSQIVAMPNNLYLGMALVAASLEPNLSVSSLSDLFISEVPLVLLGHLWTNLRAGVLWMVLSYST